MQFNKGDRVRFTGKKTPVFRYTMVGWEGTVIRQTGSTNVHVDWDNGHDSGHYPENLELIKPVKKSFSKGDRVEYTGKSKSYADPEMIGMTGTVSSADGYGVNVDWDSSTNAGAVFPENLRLISATAAVSPGTEMRKNAREMNRQAELLTTVARAAFELADAMDELAKVSA